MKILHYIPTYAPAWSYGGPVRSVSALCEELTRQGHDVTVFTTDAGLEKDEKRGEGRPVERNGVTVHYFPRVSGYGIKSPALEAAARQRVAEYDLVHVTAIWQRTGPAACRAARRAGVPYVMSPRGALGPYSWRHGTIKKLFYYFMYERRNLSEAAGFHYTSAMEAAECERFRFGKPSCTVSNAIDLNFWQRDVTAGRAWRHKRGIAEGETVLLYAGRLHHKKGLDLLPEILRQGSDTGQRMRLVLVGPEEDDTAHRLRMRFAALSLDKQVIFLPLTPPEELKTIYSGADIFMLPSLHENFGNAAVEAAACGCWVLASEQVGVARELAASDAGECLVLDASVWIAAIIGRVRKMSQMGDSSIQSGLESRFGVTAMADRMAKFYKQIISTRRNSTPFA